MAIQILSSLSIPEGEIEFQFTRSSGPGGQNVNKVSTRVELLFDVNKSATLSVHQKELVLSRLRTRVDSSGVLHVASQESRSQWKNREAAADRFADLIRSALKVNKKRHRTSPTHAAKEQRLKIKKRRSFKKSLRKKPGLAEE